MPRGFHYSRWDGTQVGFELDADSVLAEITDDLLYHGDLNAALRRMLQSGFRDQNGERLAGIRELLERLRRRRRDELERYDLGGVYDDIAQELRDVVEMERSGIDELEQEARDSGDERRREITEQAASERRAQLDMLPPDLAGMVRELSDYDFTSSEARERFDELVDKLKQQLMQSYFNQMAGAMSDVSPEHMARMKDMFSALNQMLEMREAGQDPLGFAEAAQLMDQLGDIDQLENLLRSATSPGALAEVDLDAARNLLGDDAARSLERLAELARMLEEAGLIEQREGRFELTPRGMRRIGQNALADLFAKLNQDRFGRHEVERTGVGNELSYET